jgi:signal transduction histidine kinase
VTYWQFTPYTFPLIATVIIAFALVSYGFRKRDMPHAIPFVSLCLIAGLWALLSIAHYGATDFQSKDVMTRAILGLVSLMPVVWVVFITQYTQTKGLVSRRALLFMLVIPFITNALIWTNDLHHLVYLRRYINVDSPLQVITSDYGPWFWLHTLYSYALIALGIALLVRKRNLVLEQERWRATLLIIGVSVPWFLNILFITRIVDLPVDLTPLSLALTLSMFTVSIFQFQMFNLLPLAFENVVRQLPDPVLIITADNKIAFANSAAEQLLRMPLAAMQGSDPTKTFASYGELLQRFVGQMDGVHEIKREYPDKPARWLEVRINTLHDDREMVAGRMIVLRDVTAQKQNELYLAKARDEALVSSQYKTQILGKVSHDLRTPLGAVIGYAELMLMGMYGEMTDEQREGLTDIHNGAKDLDKFIKQLIDQTHLQDRRLKLAREAVPLATLAAYAESLRPLSDAREHTLTVYVDPSLPQTVIGDCERLQQITHNLLTNAIKFTRKRGTVAMRLLRVDEARWAIEVEDTGIGIAPEDQRNIFEPWRQVAIDVTSSRKGSGLGLSFVRDLTAFMGGEVRLDSEVGRGSRFTVILPLVTELEKAVAL